MLFFTKRFQDGIVRGEVTLTFRRWDRARVKVGGRYRVHPIGVVEVTGLARVSVDAIGEDDARAAGFGSIAELRAYLAEGPQGPLAPGERVHRVALVHGGDGDRVQGALDRALSPDDVRAIDEALARLDGDAPWTRATLARIAENPRVAASKLAALEGQETAPFKARVVKLKKLGLTQSFEVGYEIAPRGEAYLAARPRGRRPSARAR
jgi:hypothetical protein